MLVVQFRGSSRLAHNACSHRILVYDVEEMVYYLCDIVRNESLELKRGKPGGVLL